MENVQTIAQRIAMRALAALSLESLTAIYHEAADRMIDQELYQQQYDIMEPLMEYHVDGIDEAADDEAQTHLRTLTATAIVQMHTAVVRAENARKEAR